MAFGPTTDPVKFMMPNGKLALWTFTSRTSNDVVMSITDNSGTVLATQTSTEPSNATGSFQTTSGPYRMAITFNGNGLKLAYACTATTITGAIAEETFIFGAEGGDDADFNECFATVSYYKR
jgi:hypothetical protein